MNENLNFDFKVGQPVMHDDGTREGFIVEINGDDIKVDWGFDTITIVKPFELLPN